MALGRKSASESASAEECCAKCESDVAELRKEVAALKKALAAVKKSGGGGADPRVDKLIEALKLFGTAQKQKLEKAGL